MKKFILNVILLLVTVLLSLTLAEFALRALEKKPHYVWPPNLKEEFNIAEGVLPGVEGTSKFSINSQGIRGDEFDPAQDYHILAVGGSTTECIFLDDEEAWPKLTQKKLNAEGYNTWVGNVGKSGARSTNHLKDARALLEFHPQIDALVFLLGINDLYDLLSYSLEGEKPELAQEKTGPFYTRTALWKKAKQIQENLKTKEVEEQLVQDNAGLVYKEWRKNRAEAQPKEDYLPLELDEALLKYKTNLYQLIELGEEKGVRTIFMTQPTLWRENLTPEEDALLWAGWGGAHQADSSQYYSVRALKEGMDKFNQTLWDVCSEKKLECIDLDRQLPKDTTIFYDDCHFNENGSEEVAEILTAYLQSRKPFKRKAPKPLKDAVL